MSVFEDLLALQDVDTTIDQLRHRLEALSERAEQARIAAEIAALDTAIGDAEARRDAVRREQRRHEDEVASIEERVEHVGHQLYDSGITSPKAAADLQADLDSLRRRQRELEDLVLEQMELAEPIDEELTALASRHAVLDDQLVVATEALGAAAGSVGDDLADAESRRASLAGAVPDGIAATYVDMRRRLGGVAVARLAGNRCDGCHLMIPSAELEGLRKAPPDEMVQCPECTRILVR